MMHHPSLVNARRKTPFITLMLRRYPSTVFREWIQSLADHFDEIGEHIKIHSPHSLKQFHLLKARFSLMREEAEECCCMLDGDSLENAWNQTVGRISRVMLLMSELHSDADALATKKLVAVVN